MKIIYFLRHAKSDWSGRNQKDFDRGLNDRGLVDAPRLGESLLQKKTNIESVYSSSAKRTRMTSELVLESLNFQGPINFLDELYECSLLDMLNIINDFSDDINNVMIVGHNPSISYVCDYLGANGVGDLPTCGLVKMIFDVNEWAAISKDSGVVEYTLFPKML